MRASSAVFLLLLLGGFLPAAAWGQRNPNVPTDPVCGIYFDYDAAGNRIRRMYDCRGMAEAPDPSARGAMVSNGDRGSADTLPPPPIPNRRQPLVQTAGLEVFPNPTSGEYTLRLSGVAVDSKWHYHWYDSKGLLVLSGYFNGGHYSGHLRDLPSGTYRLYLYSGTDTRSATVVKQ